MAARRGGGGDGPGLVWDRPEPPDRPVPSALSRDRIVAAAIGIADAEGLAAVSIRKVAAELNAGPMRMYTYLSTKEELLDLMADAVYGEIPLPRSAGQDWREALRTLADRTRRAARRHEWFADLLGGRPLLGPNALAHLEASLAALADAPGFEDIDTVVRVRDAVNAYVIGAIRNEITERRAERDTGLDKEQWQLASSDYLNRVIASGRHPMLAKVVRDARDRDADTKFDTGLEYLFDGIAARLAT